MQLWAKNTGLAILPARCRRRWLACHYRRLCCRYLRASGGPPSAQELLRILENTLHQHLKVQMGTCGTPGVANLRNLLPTAHDITLLDQDTRRMGIARHQLIAMVDFDHIAIVGVIFLSYHDTASSSQNRG